MSDAERACSALGSLDPGVDRETWVKYAMAFKAAGGDFDTWHDWSSTAGNYRGEADCRSVWKSINGCGGVGAGTLFHEARAAGWTDRIRPAETEQPIADEPEPPGAKGPSLNPQVIWQSCKPVDFKHDYIQAKLGLTDGLRVYHGPLRIAGQAIDSALVAPVSTLAGDLVSLQFILPQKKLFLPGVRLAPDACFMVGGQIKPDEQIYITEGLGQAWALSQVSGQPAVVSFGAGRMASVTKAFRERYPAAKLVIVPDAGKTDQAAAIAAAVGGQYIELPQEWPNNYDVNDLFVEAGPADVRALLGQVKTPHTKPQPPAPWQVPAPITPEEWRLARHAPDCIVSSLIYADVRLMIAPGGTGKTTLMLHEAICIALGLPLWGHDIGRPGTVVILTAEDSREMLTARLRSMAHAMNLAPEQAAIIMDRVRLSDVSGLGFKLTVVEDDVVLPSDKIDMLIAGLLPLKPSMVVIDPAVSFGVGESRVNDAEQGLIEAARRLRNGLNCCVQYIHHTGKANARERATDQYAGRGGSAFADGSRMVCVMAPIGRDEWLMATGQLLLEGEHAIRLALPKLSYCAPQPDILIRRTGYLFEHVERAENGKNAVLDANADMIYRLLISEFQEERRHTRNTLEVVSNLKRADLRSAIHWLVASGRVLDKDFKRPGSRGGSRYLHPVVPGEESDPNEEMDPCGEPTPGDESVPDSKTVSEEDYVPEEDSDGLGSPDDFGEPKQGYAL